MGKLVVYEKQMLASPDQQISLTDPDSRSMATSGRGSGVVGYNVQVAVDTDHHLIIAHEVTNSGSDRAQLANMAMQAKAVLGVNKLEAVADRGYYSGEEIKACEDADIAVTLPKPATSGMEAKGQFGKHDFAYLAERMFIAALLANCWPIGSQRWMESAPFGVTRRKLVVAANSSLAARRLSTGSSPVGSTST